MMLCAAGWTQNTFCARDWIGNQSSSAVTCITIARHYRRSRLGRYVSWHINAASVSLTRVRYRFTWRLLVHMRSRGTQVLLYEFTNLLCVCQYWRYDFSYVMKGPLSPERARSRWSLRAWATWISPVLFEYWRASPLMYDSMFYAVGR